MNNLRIILADDDIISRTMLAETIRGDGYEVAEANNGLEAEALVKSTNCPTLLLLDWEMPLLSGLEICSNFSKEKTLQPIYKVLITGKNRNNDIIKGLDSGADDYIKKPYDINELRARIRVGIRMLSLQTSLMKAKEELEYRATHDHLTKVYNRSAIMESFSHEWARYKRGSSEFTLGFFDIDHFKKINDTFGHSTGDDILQMVCDIIASSQREYDIFGRYGGEEFLLIAPQTKLPDHSLIYSRILQKISDHSFVTPKGIIPVTVSIGVASSAEVDDKEELLALADNRLYSAKSSGRNRVVCE